MSNTTSVMCNLMFTRFSFSIFYIGARKHFTQFFGNNYVLCYRLYSNYVDSMFILFEIGPITQILFWYEFSNFLITNIYINI